MSPKNVLCEIFWCCNNSVDLIRLKQCLLSVNMQDTKCTKNVTGKYKSIMFSKLFFPCGRSIKGVLYVRRCKENKMSEINLQIINLWTFSFYQICSIHIWYGQEKDEKITFYEYRNALFIVLKFQQMQKDSLIPETNSSTLNTQTFMLEKLG